MEGCSFHSDAEHEVTIRAQSEGWMGRIDLLLTAEGWVDDLFANYLESEGEEEEKDQDDDKDGADASSGGWVLIPSFEGEQFDIGKYIDFLDEPLVISI